MWVATGYMITLKFRICIRSRSLFLFCLGADWISGTVALIRSHWLVVLRKVTVGRKMGPGKTVDSRVFERVA